MPFCISPSWLRSLLIQCYLHFLTVAVQFSSFFTVAPELSWLLREVGNWQTSEKEILTKTKKLEGADDPAEAICAFPLKLMTACWDLFLRCSGLCLTKGTGQSPLPWALAATKYFLASFIQFFLPLLGDEKCRMGHEGSCGRNEWQSCGKVRRRPKYVVTTKNVFHLWVSRHNLWYSDPYFLIHVLSLLYRKVRTLKKKLLCS